MTMTTTTNPNDFYTPENDIVETLEDGRTILIAPAGVPIPMHIARQRGFIKDDQTPGPSEKKAKLTDEERIEVARGETGVSVNVVDKRPTPVRKPPTSTTRGK